MPLCDKLSPKPLSQPIRRPFRFVAHLIHRDGHLENAVHDRYTAADHVRLGSICAPHNSKVSKFSEEIYDSVVERTWARSGPGGSAPQTTPQRQRNKPAEVQMRAKGLTPAIAAGV